MISGHLGSIPSRYFYSKMAITLKTLRAKFPGLKDVLVGVLVGAGLTKIYYETRGTPKDESSGKQEEIEKIIQKNENLKSGKAFRTIDLTEGKDLVDSWFAKEFCKYGAPQSPVKNLKYINHWVCYDQAKKVPIWVAEHLTRDKMKGPADREEARFTEDLNLPAVFQSHNQDYLGSGWVRGHMAPAADNKYSQEAMNETFLLSNIVPQNSNNNSNFWFRLESYCRGLTKRYSDVYVISGPLFLPSSTLENGSKLVKYEVIGECKVAVPTHLFKVILAEKEDNQPLLGAFVVPNQPISNDHQLSEFEVPLETLSKESGILFFSDDLISSAGNLCQVDGCKLVSKEFMDRIFLSSKLRRCKSLEQLEKVWKDAEEGGITDDTSRKVYEEMKKELMSVTATISSNDDGDSDKIINEKVKFENVED